MENDNFFVCVLEHIKKIPDHAAVLYKHEGRFRELSYREFGEKVSSVALWLRQQGIKKGDRVAILSENSVYWAIADMAVISTGAITVSIYPTLPPREVKYILQNSGSTVIFAQNLEQYNKITDIWKELPRLKKIILFSDARKTLATDTVTIESIFSRIAPDIESLVDVSAAVSSDEPLCIIYTSGTTGPPKGVVLTHGNILSVLRSILLMIPDRGIIQRNLSFLPLSHALERIAGLFMSLYLGRTIAFAESLDTLMVDMKETAPTHAVAVPRVFEKIFEKIVASVRTQSRLKQNLFWWSVKTGRDVSAVISKNASMGMLLRVKYFIAWRILYGKLHRATGGKLRYFISGGAPLSTKIAEFFHAAGILILEGWGSTELSAPATWNSPLAYRFGSVGKPIPGVYVRILSDGELIVKGPNVFKEYWRNDEATREAKDASGWFHTGDIGRIDDDGYVYITDRKKELIITAAGKNISPSNIERLMMSSPYISNIMVYGDRQKYITALVVPDTEQVLAYCRENNIDYDGLPLSRIAGVRSLIESELQRLNNELARFEQVKKCAILDEDFTVENGMMTPTLKLKRKNIIARYETTILSMYEESAVEAM